MLFILLTHSVEIYFLHRKLRKTRKGIFSFFKVVEIFDYLLYSAYMMMLGDGYLDDDFLYLGGSGDTQLRHVAVLGVEDGEVAEAKGEG